MTDVSPRMGRATDPIVAAVERDLARGLTAVLGLVYAALGTAAHGVVSLVGIVGGLVVVAIAAATGRVRPVLVVVGLSVAVVPFAAATWWSIVTPLIAVVTVAMGSLASATPGTGRRGRAARRSAA